MLDQLVEAVRGGESQTLVVRGEPGVGKTALLDYVAEHVSGCRVVRAAGVQSEMELAFAVIASSRGPESLAPVAAALGAGVSAGTIGEAAASAIVVIAVPWASVPAAVAGLAWRGEIVVGATNAFLVPDLQPAELDGRSSSEIVAELVAGARVVKAANTLGSQLLGADPHDAGGRGVLFLSGDDVAAKAEVAKLFEAAGFLAIDLGDLATGDAYSRLRAARFQGAISCSWREDPGLPC